MLFEFSKNVRVCCREEVPPWLKESNHLTVGHRQPQSFLTLTSSIFTLHNETMSIWTHLIGAIVCGLLMLSVWSSSLARQQAVDVLRNRLLSEKFDRKVEEFNQQFLMPALSDFDSESFDIESFDQTNFSNRYKTHLLEFAKQVPAIQEIESDFRRFKEKHVISSITSVSQLRNFDWVRQCHNPKTFIENLANFSGKQIEVFPIYIFCISAMLCLLLSAVFHLYTPLSERSYRILLKLDHLGIAQHVPSSSFANFYYIFYCRPFLRDLYSYSILAIGVVVLLCNVTPALSGPSHRGKRAYLFVLLGVSNLVPASHAIYLSLTGGPESFEFPIWTSLFYLLLMGLSYACGIFFFISHLPEKRFPKKFDILLNSHAIWHLFVLMGMFFCWLILHNNYSERVETRCGYCSA